MLQTIKKTYIVNIIYKHKNTLNLTQYTITVRDQFRESNKHKELFVEYVALKFIFTRI